ncbi:MAG: FtsX-like permease family protein [Bacteroidales bacterium]
MMNSWRFILRSLTWYRKQHLAIAGGTLLATMVITGALIIGDSVRYSLSQLAYSRLGNARYFVSTGGRLLRDTLATDLSEQLDAPAASLLLLQGITINQESGERKSQVQVIGMDSCFWQFSEEGFPELTDEEVIISENLAHELKLDTGSMLLVRIGKAGVIPLDVPLAPENQPSVSLRLRVIGIAGDKSLGRFSLKSNQLAPYNVFISRSLLAREMDIPGFCNGILIGENEKKVLLQREIPDELKKSWTLRDAGLQVHQLKGTGEYELVSDRIFIDPVIIKKIDSLQMPHRKILTYLANFIHTQNDSTPYSFVSAIEGSQYNLQPGEALVNQWLADDLKIRKGDSIHMDYFLIGSLRRLAEKTSSFKVKEIIPTRGGIVDPGLMPQIPGLSDAGSCRDWNAGVPVKFDRIRDKDEKYWDDYRGTPKVVIGLDDGVSLWKSKFGSITSVRFDAKEFTRALVPERLLSGLSPGELGITVVPVYSEGLAAAANAIDFGQLFLGLSFFIILAAIMLLLLIYSLATSARASETALLSGLGINRRLLLKLRISESAVVIILGSICGALAGILYNLVLVKALNTVWQEAVQTNMIQIHVSFTSLLVGTGAGFILAFTTIFLLTRRKLRDQVAASLRDSILPGQQAHHRSLLRTKLVTLAGLTTAILLLGWSLLTQAYENAALFLAAGAFFLVGAVSAVLWYLESIQQSREYLQHGLLRLSLKNAGRNQRRSLSVILIMAIGVFSIILTGAYRKNFTGSGMDKKSGTGGYLFWAETTLPVPDDLNRDDSRLKYFGKDSLLSQVSFLQFFSLEGDDASCLNLNQVNRPRILGVKPEVFGQRDAFSFVNLLPGIDQRDPWSGLTCQPGNTVIPAFADQSVIQYGLQKSTGDTLYYLDEAGRNIALVLSGGLDNSVFQGSILINEEALNQHFPSSGGSRVMLIDAPQESKGQLNELLQQSLQDFGLSLSGTALRLTEFHSVENTYLSVFMILGGLGLLLGTLGLAIVLYRNSLERRHELALLTALGFRENHIVRLIFYENLFLFMAGLGAGVLAAVISILPSWLSPGFETQTAGMVVITLLVLFSGILWIYFPARRLGRRVSMEALRNE